MFNRTVAVCMLVVIASWSFNAVTAGSLLAASTKNDKTSRQIGEWSSVANRTSRAALLANRAAGASARGASWMTASGQTCSLSFTAPFLNLFGSVTTTTTTTTCAPSTSSCTLPALSLTACDAQFTASSPFATVAATEATHNIFVSAAPTGTVKGGTGSTSCFLYLTPPAPFTKIRVTCTNAAGTGAVGVTATGVNVNGATVISSADTSVTVQANQAITSWPSGTILLKLDTTGTNFVAANSCSWTSLA